MGMSPKKWFKTIVNLQKLKKDRSKQAKVLSQSSAEKSDESSMWKHDTHEVSRSIANDGLRRTEAIPPRLIEDIAAARIQNAFRSFLSPHLRGVVKFEAFIQDHMAREQTATALSYIHSRSRVQDQIRARRLCMVTEARIKQKRLENQLKLEVMLHELEVEWCSGSDTPARSSSRETRASPGICLLSSGEAQL